MLLYAKNEQQINVLKEIAFWPLLRHNKYSLTNVSDTFLSLWLLTINFSLLSSFLADSTFLLPWAEGGEMVIVVIEVMITFSAFKKESRSF